MVPTYINSALGAFLCAAVIFPAQDRYRSWKAARPELVARKNWRGVMVPDLTLIRLERAGKASLVLVLLLGSAALYGIMFA